MPLVATANEGVYQIPAPRVFLALAMLPILLLAIALTPGFLLSHAPLDLVDRRGGLGVAALAIAVLLLFVILATALSG